MKLESIYRHKDSIDVLYRLLQERTPEQSISHNKMPSLQEHYAFVESRPYQAWYLIIMDEPIGSIYLSKQREIGVFVFERFQGLGYGEQAIKLLMAKWPGRFLANINPNNEYSMRMFHKLGFHLIQQTFERSNNVT